MMLALSDVYAMAVGLIAALVLGGFLGVFLITHFSPRRTLEVTLGGHDRDLLKSLLARQAVGGDFSQDKKQLGEIEAKLREREEALAVLEEKATLHERGQKEALEEAQQRTEEWKRLALGFLGLDRFFPRWEENEPAWLESLFSGLVGGDNSAGRLADALYKLGGIERNAPTEKLLKAFCETTEAFEHWCAHLELVDARKAQDDLLKALKQWSGEAGHQVKWRIPDVNEPYEGCWMVKSGGSQGNYIAQVLSWYVEVGDMRREAKVMVKQTRGTLSNE